MAISVTQVWELRTTGSDTNGGGFDAGVVSPGTDWSQQNGAQVAFNGSTVTATITGTGKTITITGYTVLATDNGNTINIISGTGAWVAGWYTITSVSTGVGGTWTLDRNCTSGTSSALVANMGGALASFSKMNTLYQTTNVGAVGQITYVKATANYTFTSQISITGANLGSFNYIGYTTTRGDNGQATVTTATNSTILFQFTTGTTNYAYFSNFIFSNSAGTRAVGFGWSGAINTYVLGFKNCVFDGFTSAIDMNANGPAVHSLFMQACTIKNSSASQLILVDTFQSATYFLDGCLIQSGSSDGIRFNQGSTDLGGILVLTNTVIYNNTGIGINCNSSTTNWHNPIIKLVNSAIVSSGSDGIRLGNNSGASITAFFALYMINCIISQNGGYGVNNFAIAGTANIYIGNNNFFYGNTTAARNNFPAFPGDVTGTGDPFTSKSTGDFTLNGTAGAGAACTGVGWPTVIPQ